MKKYILFTCTAAALILASCNNASDNTAKTDTTPPVVDTTAVAKQEPAPPPPMDSATMMKKWQEYMTPGEPHKILASMTGKWNEESKMWMDPAKPPTESKGSADVKMILSGRYQESHYTGEMMGMPFEGMGTMAYDNAEKKFINTWIDNMGTGMMVMKGDWDNASKTFNLKGKCLDPMSGQEIECRQTMKLIDDKNAFMEMFMTQGGKEMKTMEMKMTKK